MADILDWEAESIQASIFVSGPHAHTPSSLFRAAFQTDPMNTQESTNAQFGKTGTASDNDKDVGRSVSLQPGRCDIIVGSIHQIAETFEATGKITNILATIEAVRDAAIRVAEFIGTTDRLAVHCRLARGSNTIAEANAKILRAMPVKIPLSTEQDFVLQLNWPTTAHGRRINRLVKWSVETIVIQMEQLGIGVSQRPVQREAIVSIVQLDFNTHLGNTTFTPEEARQYLDALTQELISARKNDLRFKS